MSWYNKLFKKQRQFDRQTVLLDNQAVSQLYNGSGITTNQEVRDRRYIEEGFQKNPTVQSIISITQRNAAQVPWKIYKKDKNGKMAEFHDRLLENIMLQPNTAMTWHDLVNELIGFYMLQGDMYLWGLNGSGINKDKFTILRPLPSQHVQIKTTSDASGYGGIQGYSLDYARTRNAKKIAPKSKQGLVEIAPENMMHLTTFNPEYDEDGTFFYGQSPLRALRRTLAINNTCIDTAYSILENQGIRGLLYHKGDYNQEVDESQIDALQEQFNKKRGGVNNTNQVGVTNGEFGFLNLMNKTSDMELIDQWKYTTQEICMTYGFPAGLLGVGKDTYKNMPEYKKQLWNDVIIPMLSKFRDGLNCWLTPQFGDDIYIDFDLKSVHAIQEDKLMRAKAIREAFAGSSTVDEVRAMNEMGPHPDTEVGASTFQHFTQSGAGDNKEPNNKKPDEDEASK